MKTILHKKKDRGYADYGWLKTHYSFSFANWYDENKMGFGALRVLNDDVIAPGSGFGTHSHKDMEIITIVTNGAVAHKDSMGNHDVVRAGEVQVMSAGTGVLHSEYNDSQVDELALFQIWISPNKNSLKPRYDQKKINFLDHKNGILPLVNSGKETLMIHQDASISYGVISNNQITVSVSKNKGVYVFVIKGNINIADTPLTSKDAIGISDTDSFKISGRSGSAFLLVQVPIES